VIIHLDTSALIEIAATTRPLLRAARAAIARGDILALSTITAYEWLRGPRTEFDLELQRELCPADRVVTFGPTEAALAATLYRQLKSTRGREADIAIAACALEHGAAVWTVNPRHFQDIPGLRLYAGRLNPGAGGR